MEFREFVAELQSKIEQAYTERVTADQAEQLAGEFLHAQMVISNKLSNVGLDARMRKSGVKGVKAAVYLAEVQKSDRKPTEAMLTAIIDTNPLVAEEQDHFDRAENVVEELERLYNIYQQSHVYFRQLAKGSGGI